MDALKKVGRLDPKTIVIFRALYLGDLLNAVPAFRSLRAAFPAARITLVGLPEAEEFVQRFHFYLDDFIPFPGFPGLPEQAPDLRRLISFLEKMQALNFDLAIQMQGAADILNPLIDLFGAKQSAGFYQPGQYCPDPKWFLDYPVHESEVWRHLRLMEFLGIPPQSDELEFPLFDGDWNAFEQIKSRFALKQDYVCIHPGANARQRRWPPSNFAVIADHLAARGYQIVLTGTEKEAHLSASVALHMRAPAVDLTGKTDLGTLGALISKAHLVVSNDTDTSHVAAALKTPSVTLFPVPESIRWAPQNQQLHRRVWDAMGKEPAQVLPHVEDHLNNLYPAGPARAEI